MNAPMLVAGRLSRLKLREQLVACLVVAGLVPLAMTATVLGLRAGDALESQASNQLASLRAAKGRTIEDYFAQVRDQVLTFSESAMIVEAMGAFRAAFHTLPDELGGAAVDRDGSYARLEAYYREDFGAEYERQNGKAPDLSGILPPRAGTTALAQSLYIGDNPNPLGSKHALDAANDGSTYSRLHARYHPIIRSYLEKFGYYDIFLVDPATGHIVYSVFKELDFGTSLTSGPYRDTNFARAFRAAAGAATPDAVFLEDFEAYGPSYEAAASFIASPIVDGGEVVGVLVFQMPVGRINEIMQQTEGLGETGETYLVGRDLSMRSQSRFTDEPTILARKVDTEGARAAIEGQTGVATYDDYRGVPVLAAYAPLDIEGLKWGVLAEIDTEEAFAAVGHLRAIAVAVALVTLLVTVVYALWFARLLSGRVKRASAIAHRIADGHFDNTIGRSRNDEIGELLAALDTMQTELFGRLSRERNEAMRIKAALDGADANVMIADTHLDIVYMNRTLTEMFEHRESTMRSVLPEFDASELVGRNIDVFHKNPAHQRAMLEKMTSVFRTEIAVGDLRFNLTATPVFSESGDRLGTMVEWLDITEQKHAEAEVEHVLGEAIGGRLDARLDTTRLNGFMQRLATNMNRMLEEIVRPMREGSAVMAEMAAGRLKARVEGEYQGEFAELSDSVNRCIGNLTDTLMSINASSESLSNGAGAIAQGNTELRARTEEQAAALEQTASSMEEMTATVQQNAANARQADDLAAEAKREAESGGEVVRSAMTAMSQITESSTKIASIISTIDEIAFQTNLLALNAAVEAARAGEQGRGFAVVANEVRSLAQRSAGAAREIKTLISDSVERVEDGSRLVDESGERLDAILASVKKVSDIVSEITAASGEQAAGIDQINQAIAEMDRMTQRNAAMSEEAASSSEAMEDEVKSLRSLVSFFDV